MPKCSFCGEEYEFPRGLTYVTADGKIFYFCSSKCRKNMLSLKRDKLKVGWVRKAPWNAAEVAAKLTASREYEAKKTAEALKEAK